MKEEHSFKNIVGKKPQSGIAYNIYLLAF